jgi:hypothetical protein
MAKSNNSRKSLTRTNSSFRVYQRNLVGGSVRHDKSNILGGQIISFKYLPPPTKGGFIHQEKTRSIPRLVFVVNPRDTLRVPTVLHGINLEYTGFMSFRRFLSQIQTNDMVTLIKRRYEVRGPFDRIIDSPSLWWSSWIKPYIEPMGAYRTYIIKHMANIRLHALNYTGMFPNGTDAVNSQLIDKFDRVQDILGEYRATNQLIGKNSIKLNNSRYRSLIEQKFKTVADFKSAIQNIEDYIDSDSVDDTE